MAKINTLNYQTVAAWNGSQDLFIVEQPDGTKVATPAMVKQFIEAGDFVATGEIEDGHGNTLNNVANAIETINYDGAGAHNAIYRGKNLGTSFTAEQSAVIGDGSFKDLYIGDYWTINGTVYRIADFDYFLHSGDTECTAHHVVIVPDENMDTQKMNDSNTTAGAYVGSKMYTTNMATAKNKIKADFGASHILSHREYLANAVVNGKQSAVAWYDSEIELMTEQMVYGGNVFAPVSDGSTVPALYTIGCKQLNLFRYRPDMISNRQSYWLRDVASATIFASVYYGGVCTAEGASANLGVRPAFCVK